MKISTKIKFSMNNIDLIHRKEKKKAFYFLFEIKTYYGK
jgi:hypothetical protein